MLKYFYSVFLSGAGNSTGKHRNARFLFDIFDKPKPEHNIIPSPSQQDSSAKQICRSRCQKGWINYKGHCYMLIQERMTWLEEVNRIHLDQLLQNFHFFSLVFLHLFS
uniref:Uncharacterized protein n=1 Tax=Phasianus colchicus TaxID=9054 RepID=A0A669R1E6_PHACC